MNLSTPSIIAATLEWSKSENFPLGSRVPNVQPSLNHPPLWLAVATAVSRGVVECACLPGVRQTFLAAQSAQAVLDHDAAQHCSRIFETSIQKMVRLLQYYVEHYSRH